MNFVTQHLIEPYQQLLAVRPFFFDYLVYGSADPILQDFEEEKKIKLYIV